MVDIFRFGGMKQNPAYTLAEKYVGYYD